jgi:hypothetical protein
LSDDIAQRVLVAYARVSGKTKTEAQIDFLHTLWIYCPFYGSSFFEVHCQYDDDPLNPQSSPPVLTMTAAIGPQALFLVSQSDQPTIIRHPYSRIMKWLCRAEKHIFTYWVIKKDVTLSRLEEMLQENGDAFDARPYCDCVYLVTSQSLELTACSGSCSIRLLINLVTELISFSQFSTNLSISLPSAFRFNEL